MSSITSGSSPLLRPPLDMTGASMLSRASRYWAGRGCPLLPATNPTWKRQTTYLQSKLEFARFVLLWMTELVATVLNFRQASLEGANTNNWTIQIHKWHNGDVFSEFFLWPLQRWHAGPVWPSHPLSAVWGVDTVPGKMPGQSVL